MAGPTFGGRGGIKEDVPRGRSSPWVSCAVGGGHGAYAPQSPRGAYAPQSPRGVYVQRGICPQTPRGAYAPCGAYAPQSPRGAYASQSGSARFSTVDHG
jgi:hypothetical protein